MKDIVIVGNGGFARETEWLIGRINKVSPEWDFKGFIDNKKTGRVAGDDSFLLNYRHELYVVVAIGLPYIREKLYRLYRKNPNLYFPNIIDPGVIMSGSVSLGTGNIICANTVLTVGISVGNFCIINLGCTVGHDAVIKDFVTVNPGVNVSGNVVVDDLADLGTGTKIIQGKTIGRGTRTGAGAVVINDLPGGCTAVGVPAKPVQR